MCVSLVLPSFDLSTSYSNPLILPKQTPSSTMAVNAASNAAQAVLGDMPTTTTNKHTDLTSEEASAKGETMMALTWQGKGKVEMKEMPKPKIMEDHDALIKVTGSTVCGSDLVSEEKRGIKKDEGRMTG